MSARSKRPRLEPIRSGDIADVAAFLHRELDDDVAPEDWEAAMRSTWQSESDNHGVMLVSEDRIVGVYLAYYHTRTIDGRAERFCNLGAWCVEEPYRFSSLRMIRWLLDQDGCHFTDFSPSGNVVPLNEQLGFDSLDTATALVANLPMPSRRGPRLIVDPEEIAASIVGVDREIFLDHRDARGCRHLLLVDGDRQCYVVYRADRRRGLRLFASLLYVSDPDVLAADWARVARHLLLRRRLPMTLAEHRVVGRSLGPSIQLDRHRPKMFKSHSMHPEQIDYLYSELVAVAW